GERDAFYANAADQGITVKQRYAFDTLWNGVSVDIAAADAGKLASIPGVTAVYPVFSVSLGATPRTEPASPPTDGEVEPGGGVSSPELKYSTGTIGATAANAAGWTGDGVKVGVIDSGIDYTNPDLSNGFGPGHRV